MFLVAEMPEDGRGEAINLHQAVAHACRRWRSVMPAPSTRWRSAARQSGVPRDDRAAVHWFSQAAEQAHAAAQYSLGFASARKGLGLTADDDLAVRWFRRAAEQGHARAQR